MHRTASSASPQRGVRELILVRHGESAGNAAAAAAEAGGLDVIDLDTRDADTPLSPRGEEQAAALGDWLRAAQDPPDVVWCSPYVRARQTTEIALHAAGSDLSVRIDERLRDRELGVLDLLTSAGVASQFPAEAARRRHLGKFYYRPPGGESWADLALRARSMLGDLDRAEDGRRVLVVAHDAVISIVRYICEGLSEVEVLDLARSSPVRNAAVSRLVREADGWRPTTVNDDRHLVHSDAPVTQHPGDRDVYPH